MTLVLGAKCVDGISLIGDTKTVDLEGTYLGNEPKLYGELSNVIFGCAGALDMIHLFRRYVVGDVTSLRDSKTKKYTDANFLQKLIEIMHLFRRVRRGEDFSLTVMVARLHPSFSDLHVIDSQGRLDYQINNDWITIGKASHKANNLVKEEFTNKLSIKKFASLSYSVIKYLEDQHLDNSVGVGAGRPNIAYLYSDAQSVTEPTQQDWTDFEKSLPEYYTRFNKYSRP